MAKFQSEFKDHKMEYSKQKPDTVIFPLVDEISRVLEKPVVTSKFLIGADEFKLRPRPFHEGAELPQSVKIDQITHSDFIDNRISR